MFVIEQLAARGLIEGNLLIHSSSPEASQSLTLAGWDWFADLSRTAPDSRVAFMAMAYGREQSEQAFSECFSKAVEEAGFNLLRLDKLPKAGHIDLRMRVEIRTAKFLVADLSDDNRGAYWESGFAEGLGRPVFYTCEETKFDQLKTHFDTEHLLTIKWSASNFARAREELKAAIRNTFPLEAKMRD